VIEDKIWVTKTGWDSKPLYTISTSPVTAKVEKPEQLERLRKVLSRFGDALTISRENAQTIADAMGVSIPTVRRRLRELKESLALEPIATVPASRAVGNTLADRVRAMGKPVIK
jgi:hypothetical protein